MDAFKSSERELIAQLREKINALIETVEQRYVHIRLHYLEHHARKARARSDINYPFAGKIADREQRRAVEKMQPCNVLLPAYGGKVHDSVALLEIFVICLQPADGIRIGCDAELRKALVQYLIHVFSNEKMSRVFAQLILA